MSVTNWYNLAGGGDDRSLVECRLSEAAGRGRRSQLRTVGLQSIKYLRTEYQGIDCIRKLSMAIVRAAIITIITTFLVYVK